MLTFPYRYLSYMCRKTLYYIPLFHEILFLRVNTFEQNVLANRNSITLSAIAYINMKINQNIYIKLMPTN